MFTRNRLGRFRRNGSGSLTPIDRYWIDGSGDIDGLGGALGLAVSPDGKHLYSAGVTDNALAIFTVDGTGDLRFSRVLVDGSSDVDGSDTIDGLARASDIAVSSDGNHVYVAGNSDDSVTFFTRDATTGALDFQKSFKNTDASVDGLDGALGVVLSPDGNHLYATGFEDDALAVFSRNRTTGALDFERAFKNTDASVDGLDGALGLAVSPDGKHLYVAGVVDSALAVFDRDTGTGALTFEKALDNSTDGLGSFVGFRNLTISGDGKNLYASSLTRDLLVDFDRDPATGELTLHEFISIFDLATNDPDGLVLSSDGKTLYLAARNGILRFSREVR